MKVYMQGGERNESFSSLARVAVSQSEQRTLVPRVHILLTKEGLS